jgi:tRNA modification GTPase
MANTDTIVAPASAPVESALAIIRISGPLCEAIARSAFERKSAPVSRRVSVGDFHDTSGEVVDQCVFTLFNDTVSYTGEPVLEITCHGNPLITQRILRDCLARGCRSAEPGEFTRRAFLNGRLDLTQAEAVSDTIRARSDEALAVAQRQLAGALGHRVAAWTERLLQALAGLEAYIDFPEEDLPPEDADGPVAALGALADEFAHTAETARYAEVLRDGVRTVIAGAPNAGKSSLLNALLGEERALVSDEPGTTRDFIRERLTVGRHCIHIVDTAGLRSDAATALERLGMERTREQLDSADFCLLVADGSAPPPDLPPAFLRERTMLVLNKADLPPDAGTTAFLPELERVAVSAKTGAGIPEFKARLARALEQDGIVPGDTDLVVGMRHAEALRRAAEHLGEAVSALRRGAATELAASDVRLALEALGDITGRVDNERMLDKLFASFCIGK